MLNSIILKLVSRFGGTIIGSAVKPGLLNPQRSRSPGGAKRLESPFPPALSPIGARGMYIGSVYTRVNDSNGGNGFFGKIIIKSVAVNIDF